MQKEFLLSPQPTTKRLADINGPDFYPTPAWAVMALVDNEKFDGDIWECACGDGEMSAVLQTTGNAVYSSDLYDRGYGDSGLDFLKSTRNADNIITNPPFNSAEDFVLQAGKLARKKYAFLLRLAFLEGGSRQNRIFNVTPPSRVWVFSERITFYPRNAEIKGSGTTAYAWFVWEKSHTGPTELKWLPLGYKGNTLRTSMPGDLLL
jgi:hypothetical protein